MKDSTSHKLYGYPVLMNAGLGNMLFPWADCYLWCNNHNNNAEMIAPFWTKLRIGPYLRREKDKRSYQRLFNDKYQISGFKRLFLLSTVQACHYEYYERVLLEKDTIVKFTSMECMDRLIGKHEEIKRALVGMTRPEYLPSPCSEPFIAIHVRLGDYALPDDTSPPLWTSRLPIEWYVAALLQVRNILGFNLKAVIFSDGQNSELAPLLDLPHVSRSLYKEAITDILAMAEASVIIGSCSTFSTWGVYLSGNASTIWHRGRRPANIFGDDESTAELEAEWGIGDPLPELFIARLKHRIGLTGPI